MEATPKILLRNLISDPISCMKKHDFILSPLDDEARQMYHYLKLSTLFTCQYRGRPLIVSVPSWTCNVNKSLPMRVFPELSIVNPPPSFIYFKRFFLQTIKASHPRLKKKSFNF